MIRVTLEIVPHGNERKAFVAGRLIIENDQTGNTGNFKGIGNYDYKLSGPIQDGDQALLDEFWEKGRMEGFERKRGYWACVLDVLKKCSLDYDEP